MDIKISLEIGLSPALEGYLSRFLGDGAKAKLAPAPAEAQAEIAAVEEQPNTEVQNDRPQPAEPAKRRGRPPKSSSGDQAVTEAVGAASPTTQEEAPDPTDLMGLRADAPDEKAADAAALATVTKEMLSDAISEAAARLSPRQAQDILVDKGGGKRISEIPAEKWPAVYEALKAA